MGNASAGRGKRGDADGGPRTFRSPTAVMIWWVWLLFLVANLADLAVQGRDHASAVAAAILVLATGVAYVTAQRPRIIADDAGITVRNPLRDYQIGWAGVTKVDLADLLRVHCAWGGQTGGPQRTKIINAWAVHYSRRRKLAAENRARRAARPRGPRGMSRGGLGGPVAASAASAASAAEAEAEKIARLLAERATAAQAESIWATGAVPLSGATGAVPLSGATGAVPVSGANGAQPVTAATGTTGAAAPGAAGTGTGAVAGTARTGYAGEPATATGVAATGWLEPLRSTWSPKALAALIIPALILLIVCVL